MNFSPEVLVVGGGPAGSAAAIHLARAGRKVTFVEQSAAAQHKVCGEFLSQEAITYLDGLELDLHALGAMPIRAVRLAGRREIAACDLPFPAFSLTRRALDEAMLDLAAESGAEVRRGIRVNGLIQSHGKWAASLSREESLESHAAFLCTGKHDVSTHRRPAGLQNDLVAFKMYFRLVSAQQRALDGHVEIHLFPGGYAGLQMVEDYQANLCLLITRAELHRCNSEWSALLDHLRNSCDLLSQRLDGAEALLPKPLALSAIPYGMTRHTAPAGIWPLGDQAAVIPSFAGDGVSIALHSARLAAESYSRGASSMEFAHQLQRELRTSVGFATTLSRLMIAAPALAHAPRLWPGVLKHIASRTRIPFRAWNGQSRSAAFNPLAFR